MIQILGLRDFVDQRSGQSRKRETFFANNWRANSVEEILKNPIQFVEKIPNKERYNIFFTVADCFEERGRKLKEQHIICFDIDNLEGSTDEEILNQAELVSKCACYALGVEWEKTGALFSGHGVQLFVRIPRPIMSDDYFDSVRAHYKIMCDRVQACLLERGLSGRPDPSVFSKGRLMRMPNTLNRKPGKPERLAVVLQSNIEAQDFFIEQKSGISEIQGPDQILPEIIKRYPKPDTKAVLAECLFLRFCAEKPQEIVEPQWYAQVSITARLEDGPALTHQMSEGHPGYSFYETELKIEQALSNAGPRTCKNISSLWDGCKACPHYGSDLVSPILIHGPDYIRSKDHGFREMRKDLTPGKPAYADLIKTFGAEHSFVTIADSHAVYIFNGTHWVERRELFIKEWMNQKVAPEPSASEMNEFLSRLLVTNVRSIDWFKEATANKMNFKNGVLHLDTMELTVHKEEYGFTYVLPYAYEPSATSPVWDKFMQDICEEDQKLVDLMEEFAGYTVSGSPYRAHKALILVGEGRNGKNVFADTISRVVGEANCSNVMLQDFPNEQARATLANKLFNFADEASVYSLRDSSAFKALTAGGTVMAKEVYKPQFSFVNRAKFVILTNNMPTSSDTSNGLHSRLIIVELKRMFVGKDDNKFLGDQLRAELPGICNRFIQAFLRFKERGFLFDEPESVQESLNAHRSGSSVAQFCEEEVQRTDRDEDFAPGLALYAAYATWCKASGEYQLSRQRFAKELKRVPCLKGLDLSHQRRVGGRNVRVVQGIKIITEF